MDLKQILIIKLLLIMYNKIKYKYFSDVLIYF